MKVLIYIYLILSYFNGYIKSEVSLPDSNYRPVFVSNCNSKTYFSDSKNLYRLNNRAKWFKIASIRKRSEKIINGLCINDNLYILTNNVVYKVVKGVWEKKLVFKEYEAGSDFTIGTWGDIFVLTTKNIYLLSGNGYKVVKKNHKDIGRRIAVYKDKIIVVGDESVTLYSRGKSKILAKNIGFTDVKFIANLNSFVFLKKGNEISVKQDKALNGVVVTTPKPILIRGFKRKWSVLTESKVIFYKGIEKILSIDGNYSDIFLNDKRIFLIDDSKLFLYDKSINSTDRLKQKRYCSGERLPLLREVISKIDSLKYLPFERSRNWIKSIRKRGWVPKVTVSGSYSYDEGEYTNRSDNVSVSSTYQRVIVGPPEYVNHNDNGNGYDISLSFSWQLDRLVYDDQELSATYRLTDLMHEKQMIIRDIIDTYEEMKINRDSCCAGHLHDCIKFRKRLQWVKYNTGFSKELWGD